MNYNDENEKRIGEFLIEMGILDAKQVEDILNKQNILHIWKKFGEIGIELGYLTHNDISNYFLSLRN